MKINKLKLLISTVIVATLAGCGFNKQPGDGTRTGQVVMLKKEGIISETWEAEIIKGGMNGGTGSFGGQPFYFTVVSEEDAKALQSAMDSQREIEIKYHSKMFYSLFNSNSGGDFLTSFTVVTNK